MMATRLPIPSPPVPAKLKMIFGIPAAKEIHTFVLLFERSQIALAQQAVGRWACDSRVPFSWENAAHVGTALRKIQAGELPSKEF
jgi:hypothetical protein